MNPEFQKNILLSEYTTIGLGGKAKKFVSCESAESIINVLKYAKKNKLKVQVFSGGSNIIFPDDGFNGIILKIDLKGIDIIEKNNEKKYVKIRAGAGENWDEFVSYCIENNYTGIECLSGIPGSVGATPIQNVGAYGQEVRNTVFSLTAIDRETYEIKEFTNIECEFGYRQSRFKNAGKDKDKFIVTDVVFYLKKFAKPKIKYLELQKYIKANEKLFKNKKGKEKLEAVRNAVLSLRKKKSMLADIKDPNSKSCGSFFINPVLNEKEFLAFQKKTIKLKRKSPYFKSGDNYKLPAAWLVENAGFVKGFKKGNTGISENHSLALINHNGSAKELLEFADEIEKKVLKKFGIKLVKEPEIIVNK